MNLSILNLSPSMEGAGVYQLADAFSLFYMTFVDGNSSRDGEYWSSEVNEGRKNDWRGNAFERVCIAHVRQMKKALGISGVHSDVYSWKVTASPESRGAQVDLLIDRRDGIANLCEMKYSTNEFVDTHANGEALTIRSTDVLGEYMLYSSRKVGDYVVRLAIPYRQSRSAAQIAKISLAASATGSCRKRFYGEQSPTITICG